MAVDGIVERAHGEVAFQLGRRTIGASGQKAEQGNA